MLYQVQVSVLDAEDQKKNEQEAPALRTLIISDKRNLYSKQFRMFRAKQSCHNAPQNKTDIHTSTYWFLLSLRPISWKHPFIHVDLEGLLYIWHQVRPGGFYNKRCNTDPPLTDLTVERGKETLSHCTSLN